nr:methionine adenosyltransferase 2 subunit beta-like [Meriones unguiculatus]
MALGTRELRIPTFMNSDGCNSTSFKTSRRNQLPAYCTVESCTRFQDWNGNANLKGRAELRLTFLASVCPVRAERTKTGPEKPDTEVPLAAFSQISTGIMPEMPEDMEQEEVNTPSRRVLVTGATGLLGRAVYKEFQQSNWHTVGCGFRRARPKFEQVNLLDSEAVHHLIHDFQPHVIVHCAAERRPDVVESQPDAASQLNVGASGNLAKEAAAIGAFLIYISSDYVFDGTNPPYTEEDIPSPLNLYGKTKLDGEKAVLENNLGAAVLRIPVLYGEVEKLEESAVTVMFDKVQFSNKSANMDHWQQRFPTHVKDVASVCRQLAEKRMLDPSIKGTFHWSGNEQMTKYEMACAIADAFNLPSSHLRPITDSPVIGAQRPKNAQLDCSKLETLGIGQRTPFRIGIKESLWPFLIDKRWRQTVFH